jgi:hypothetical protein
LPLDPQMIIHSKPALEAGCLVSYTLMAQPGFMLKSKPSILGILLTDTDSHMTTKWLVNLAVEYQPQVFFPRIRYTDARQNRQQQTNTKDHIAVLPSIRDFVS